MIFCSFVMLTLSCIFITLPRVSDYISSNSLKPTPYQAIPAETVRVAKAAFPKGNLCIWLRDEIGTLFWDEQFTDLYPRRGQPAMSPWQLAVVTVFQFAENLTDRQAADAVRGRIDWKYALSLELTDPGFDFSVLSEFRMRLLRNEAEARLFDILLQHCTERNWLKVRGRQRTDSTHVLGAIRNLNQLELVGEAVRHTLITLAHVAPDWLQPRIHPDWLNRYQQPLSDYRLPDNEAERQQLAIQMGCDGIQLLEHIYDKTAPEWLCQVPAVETLRRIWVQQFYFYEDVLRWRIDHDPPPGQAICSPYDTEARYARKRNNTWVGYRVHLSETCEDDKPNLITNVMTTAASVADIKALDDIHCSLDVHQRLPDEHIVDAGYVSSDTLVSSRKWYDIDLVGPVRPDPSWQAKEADAYDITRFTVDWTQQVAICPQGKMSQKWKNRVGKRGKPNILVGFSEKDCQPCSARALCTRGKRRNITLQQREEFEALRAAQIRQQQEDFQDKYAVRAGVEGTISQAAFAFGLRRARYRGEEKVRLEHLLTATALNLSRVFHWATGTKRSTTRRAAFAKLVAA
jgi:transposase